MNFLKISVEGSLFTKAFTSRKSEAALTWTGHYIEHLTIFIKWPLLSLLQSYGICFELLWSSLLYCPWMVSKDKCFTIFFWNTSMHEFYFVFSQCCDLICWTVLYFAWCFVFCMYQFPYLIFIIHDLDSFGAFPAKNLKP